MDQAILRAARDLLVERGYSGTSIEAIARRAKVAKTSIYRRWKRRDDLLFRAAFAFDRGDPKGSGSFADRINHSVRLTARELRSPIARSALPGLVEACLRVDDPLPLGRIAEIEIASIGERLNESSSRKLTTKQARDEAALVYDLYHGVVIMRLLRGERLSAAFVKRTLEIIFDGVLK